MVSTRVDLDESKGRGGWSGDGGGQGEAATGPLEVLMAATLTPRLRCIARTMTPERPDCPVITIKITIREMKCQRMRISIDGCLFHSPLYSGLANARDSLRRCWFDEGSFHVTKIRGCSQSE